MTASPWALDADVDGEPTFLAHLLVLAAMHGHGPWPDGGYPFPDDPPPDQRSLFPSVAMDGSRSHHFGIVVDTEALTEIVDLLAALVAAPPDPAAAVRLHQRLAECSALDLAEALGRELLDRELLDDRVHAVGRWLVEHGTRRAAVKIGLVLVGLTGDEGDRELLMLFGSLDEFTLYAVVALVRTQVMSGHRDQLVFDLARRVRGWGRIHAVERLVGTQDPLIRAWLLREGFRSGVLDCYLAHLAADTGHLDEALGADEVDEALLDGAGDLLAAMADCDGDGPFTGLSDYRDAVSALHRYAVLVEAAEPSLRRLRAVLGIRAFLCHPPDGTPFAPDTRSALLERYERLATRPDWPAVVMAHLADPRRKDFGAGLRPADEVGLRPVPQVLAHLDAVPLDGWSWHWALDHADDVETAQLLAMAERLLPLDRCAEHTFDGLRPGQSFVLGHVLEILVAAVAARPGMGARLVGIALASPALRLRRVAARTVAAWPEESVPADTRDAVRDAAQVETDPDLRATLDLTLASGVRD